MFNAAPSQLRLLSSHGLPYSIFWEVWLSEISAKCLILLVGAAGFEPATWSTQNSRATRLRYTPPGSMGKKHPCGRCPRIDTRFRRQRQCLVAAPQKGVSQNASDADLAPANQCEARKCVPTSGRTSDATMPLA